MPVFQQPGGGVLDRFEATSRHRIESELGDGSEPVLTGPQGAQVVAGLAFQRHHDIDEVFEQLGPGDHPVLGHVTDQHHRDAAGFCQVLEARCHLADLAHRTRHGVDIIEDRGLDRVDHHQAGS